MAHPLFLTAGSSGDVPSLSLRHLLSGERVLRRSHPVPGREQGPGGSGDCGERQPVRSLPAGVSPAGGRRAPALPSLGDRVLILPSPPSPQVSQPWRGDGAPGPLPALRRRSPQHPGVPRWVLEPRVSPWMEELVPGMPQGGFPLGWGMSPAGMCQLRTLLLTAQAAPASLGPIPGESGFNPNKSPVRLIPCLPAGRRRARSPEMPGRTPGTNGTRVTLLGEEEEEAAAAQAAVLTIVPVFCAMGLLGILVCNLLKKRGYHCTASKEPQPNSTGEPWLCHDTFGDPTSISSCSAHS